MDQVKGGRSAFCRPYDDFCKFVIGAGGVVASLESSYQNIFPYFYDYDFDE